VIHLQNVSQSFRSADATIHVLRHVSAALDNASGNLAILGHAGAGKSTLVQLLAGTMNPTEGRITRHVRVSWPLGWRGLGGSFTGEECLGFLAKLHRIDRRAMLTYAIEVSGLGAKIFDPLGKLTPQEKSRLTLAAAYALDFDLYLLDGLLPKIGPEYEARYRALLLEKLRMNRVIMATSHPGALNPHFAQTVILHDSSLSPALPTATGIQTFLNLPQN
jgi:capsular polysaccharide transport system ATP-binding protein